jgi:elongator complex protein 2
VKSIAWSRNGAYLLSTSSDQTTRLHAQWKRNGKRSWHEFSRPQIHGYDLNCIDTITDIQFISGADEKLLRIFDEPAAVANLLKKLSGLETNEKELPDAANIPVLGLSNKAIEVKNSEEPGMNGEVTDATVPLTSQATQDIDRPPFEDYLSRHLLWPETEKLYGHGYEISCVAASHDGTLVATACRASSIDHALIRLYDTKDWFEIKPALRSHSLTVTSLKFSPDDKHLLSVGRDRQWTIFDRAENSQNAYQLVHLNPKAHSRMILECSWAPGEAGKAFATAGRDKCIKFWRMDGDGVNLVHTITCYAPITALDFLDVTVEDGVILAYGLEDGEIRIAGLSKDLMAVVSCLDVLRELCPSKAITSLRWRSKTEETSADRSGSEHSRNGAPSKPLELAVASDDTSVRILTLNPIHKQQHCVR